MRSSVRTNDSRVPLKVHFAARTPEDGWAIPECRKRTPDADLAPASLDIAEVTCARCQRIRAGAGQAAAHQVQG